MSVTNRVQLLPPLPRVFVDRKNDLQELKRLVGITPLGHEGKIPEVTIVEGWPGVGKSALVASLAHAPETQEAFTDGIFWISLGQHPNLLSALVAWARALGTDEFSKLATTEAVTRRLALLLKQKKMLLILDDVWDGAHVLPFQEIRGGESVLLVTTREQRVVESIAPGSYVIYRLPPLDERSGLEFLRVLAPSAVDKYPADSIDLVQQMEGLPLALQIAGTLLKREGERGWNVKEILAELKTPGLRLAKSTSATVDAILRTGTKDLDKFARQCFAMLGVFAPSPATFDLEALKAVWQSENPDPVVRELVERGLLQPAGQRFQIHPLLAEYAQSLLAADEGNSA